MKTEDYQHELLHIFFSQRRLILEVALLVYLCALAIFLFWPVNHAAYGTLLIKGRAPVEAPQSLGMTEQRTRPVSKEDLYSELQILQSTQTIGQALTRLGNAGPGEPGFNAAVNDIRNRLSAEVLPASNIIQLSLKGRDPDEAVRTLDALMSEYRHRRLIDGASSMTRDFFTDQAGKYRDMLDDGEQAMKQLFEEAGSADPQKEIETLLLVKRDLEITLNQLKNDAIEKQAVISELDKRIENKARNDLPVEQNRVIEKLMSRLIQLQTERSELLRTYRPDSQAVHKVEREMAQIRALIRGELSKFREQAKAQLQVLREQIANIETRLTEIDTRNIELQSRQIAIRRVEREADLQSRSYETFARRREEAEIENAMESADLSDYVSVVNRAYASDGPVFPTPSLIPLGLASGLLLGLALGFSREYFDHTFKRPVDVEKVLNLPVLFSLPVIGQQDTTAARADLMTTLLIGSAAVGLVIAYLS